MRDRLLIAGFVLLAYAAIAPLPDYAMTNILAGARVQEKAKAAK